MNALSNQKRVAIPPELTQLTRTLRRGKLPEVTATAVAPGHIHLSANFSDSLQDGAYKRTWAIARQFASEHPQLEMTGRFELPGGSAEVTGRHKR